MEIIPQVAELFASAVIVLVLGITLTWFAVLFSLLTSAMFGSIIDDVG